MQLAYIWAQANGGIIGKDNKLPWHLPADLAHFKHQTNHHPIIMGKNTFLSLPGVLPNRLHVVLSSSKTLQKKYKNDARVVVVPSSQTLLDWISQHEGIGYVIGGSQLFSLLKDSVDLLYVTYIHEDIDGDVTMCPLAWSEFEQISSIKGVRDAKNDYDYEFVVYRRNHL